VAAGSTAVSVFKFIRVKVNDQQAETAGCFFSRGGLLRWKSDFPKSYQCKINMWVTAWNINHSRDKVFALIADSGE